MKTIKATITKNTAKEIIVELSVEFPIYLKSEIDFIKIEERELSESEKKTDLYHFQRTEVSENSFYVINESAGNIVEDISKFESSNEYEFIKAISDLRDSVIRLLPILKEASL